MAVVAEQKRTVAIDNDDTVADISVPGVAPEPATAGAYPFDEATLGRAESVFDAGVDLGEPPVAQPAPIEPAAAADPARRQMTQRERRLRVRLEARRVRRIVRYIEPWSVFKLSLLFYFCLWLVFLVAGVILWSYIDGTGRLDALEGLIEDFFLLEEGNEFWSGTTLFRRYATITLVLSILGVALNVLLCVLYNLIAALTGGIRMTVIEEESARFRPPTRRVR